MRISDWSSDVCSSDLQGAIFLERHQDAAHLGLAASLDQPLLELRGLHVRGRIERGFKRAMFGNQLARGLGPDAADARDIVRTVTHQGQDIADKMRPDAELLLDLVDIDALVLHRIEHVDAVRSVGAITFAHQLHQILVGRDHGHIPALALRSTGIGCDKVIGLEPLLRSEEHTSELQSLMRTSYAVFCLKKKKHIYTTTPT